MKLFLCLLSLGTFCLADTLCGTCVRVADGDTLTLETKDDGQVNIRLLGIDAPERNQQFGTEAKEWLTKQALHKKLRIEFDEKDKYDRVLGTVYLGKTNLNLKLLQLGYVWVYAPSYAPVTPNPDYVRAQEQAKAAKRGLWKNPDAVAPWDFRHHAEARAKGTDTNKPTADNSLYWISNSGKTHNRNCDMFRNNSGSGMYGNTPSGTNAKCCGGAISAPR